MSAPLKSHGVPQELTSDRRRLEILEREPPQPQPRGYFELRFPLNGTLFTNQETTRYPAGFAFSVTGYRLTADSAGASTTTLRIRKIDTAGSVSTAVTISVAASTQFYTPPDPIAVGLARGEAVQIDCSSGATGLADVEVVLECQRNVRA